MNLQMEIMIPTFVSPHLFWLIDKRNLLIRAAIGRIISNSAHREVQQIEKLTESSIVVIFVDNVWARAIIHRVINGDQNERQKFVCWLIDYGVMRVVSNIYELPSSITSCPPLVKQASLHNVVNLKTDLVLGPTGYELTNRKTIGHVQGVRKMALDCLEKAQKLLFSVIDEDKYNVYGDILFSSRCKGEEKSLTKFLIENDLLAADPSMFKTIEPSRLALNLQYFASSTSWENVLINIEKTSRDEIIFNSEDNGNYPQTEFFTRRRIS